MSVGADGRVTTRPAGLIAGPPVVDVVSGSVTSVAGSRSTQTGASHPVSKQRLSRILCLILIIFSFIQGFCLTSTIGHMGS